MKINDLYEDTNHDEKTIPDEIVDKIVASEYFEINMKPYLKEKDYVVGLRDNALYHGTYSSEPFKEIDIVKRSKPRDTNVIFHDMINGYSQKKFGVSVRDLLFASTSMSFVYDYGEPYMVIPLGDYELYFNEEYEDFTTNEYAKFSNNLEDYFVKFVQKFFPSQRQSKKGIIDSDSIFIRLYKNIVQNVDPNLDFSTEFKKPLLKLLATSFYLSFNKLNIQDSVKPFTKFDFEIYSDEYKKIFFKQLGEISLNWDAINKLNNSEDLKQELLQMFKDLSSRFINTVGYDKIIKPYIKDIVVTKDIRDISMAEVMINAPKAILIDADKIQELAEKLKPRI